MLVRRSSSLLKRTGSLFNNATATLSLESWRAQSSIPVDVSFGWVKRIPAFPNLSCETAIASRFRRVWRALWQNNQWDEVRFLKQGDIEWGHVHHP